MSLLRKSLSSGPPRGGWCNGLEYFPLSGELRIENLSVLKGGHATPSRQMRQTR